MMSRLKVVSWNIWGGENLPEIIERLREMNPDVIGLQEVLQDEGGGNNRAAAIADALGYNYAYWTTTLLIPPISRLLKEKGIEKNMEWGNAILSKHKILSSRAHVLSETRKRTALEATVQVGDISLHVFSTHLAYALLPSSAEIQAVQMRNLLEILPKERGVVMGDFNATPDNETIQKMSQAMVDTESDPTKVTSDTRKLDYIFRTADIQTIESGTINSSASDHLPIYAIIEV